MLKPVLFLQSKIISESERQTKEVYDKQFNHKIGDLVDRCQEEMDATIRD